jgi:hypothetical protein
MAGPGESPAPAAPYSQVWVESRRRFVADESDRPQPIGTGSLDRLNSGNHIVNFGRSNLPDWVREHRGPSLLGPEIIESGTKCHRASVANVRQ